MRGAHDVAEVRRAEQQLLDVLPEGALMERAATGLATVCLRLLAARAGLVYGSRVVLLVGSGNNGGDALVAGARLARRGVVVDAVLLSDRPYAPGLAALLGAGGRVTTEPEAALSDADLVLDGIVGIGGRGALRPEAVALLDLVGPTAVIVAVDVPSGVDASTGQVEGAAVRADVTVTFGTLKPGLLVDPGASYVGRLELIDLGLGPRLGPPTVIGVDADDVRDQWPWAGRSGDKYARGALGVLAGSSAYPGAAALCVAGALRAGCGYVRVAAAPGVDEVVRRAWPEAVVATLDGSDPTAAVGRVQAWAVGPGLGVDAVARDQLVAVLAADLPTVLDADAVTLVSQQRALLAIRPPGTTVLTPHAGELARLLGVEREVVEARRLEHACAAAAELGVTVLLKGATTVVASPDGPVLVSATGPAELATAGAGDVLAGVCGALLAAGLPAPEAASLAAWVHGAAARECSGGGPLVAGDVAAALPRTLAAVRGHALSL